MLSQAAKSVVKNLSQRTYSGAAGEIGQTLSQYAKTGSKLQAASIPNSGPKPDLLMQTAEQSLKISQAQKIQDPRTESFPQNGQRKNNALPSYFAYRELDLERTVMDSRLSSGNSMTKHPETSGQHLITDLAPLSDAKVTGQMWALSRLPAVQQDSSASQWRQLGQTRSEGLPSYTPLTAQSRNADLTTSTMSKITSEATIPETLWLGDPDCGEGLPDRPRRGPCHPPDGPCQPMKKPGYPAKQKSPKKDFCFNCPPKKPCNLNKCPPDSCDGTSGKADFGQRNLFKLHSESQASRSDMRSIEGSQATRILATSTWNGNRPDHHRATDLRGVRRQFSSSCDGKSTMKPPKEPERVEKKCDKLKPPEPPSRPTPTEPKVLYRKCPPLPKLPKLPECPKLPEAPKCPPLPKLPKCPECPKPPEPKAEGPCTKTNVPKSQPPPSTKPEKACERKIEKSTLNSDCQTGKPDQSSTKKLDGQPRDNPKGSTCCATVPKKEDEKKKSLWDKISDGTKRKMSTYYNSTPIPNDFEATSSENPRRRFCTSGIFSSSFSSKTEPPSSDSHPQWKSRKCKTVEEVCDDIDPKLKALECKPTACPNNPVTACYPERPRCGEVRATAEKKIDKDKNLTNKSKDHRPPKVVKPLEKIDYTNTACEAPKLMKLGPCPVSQLSLEKELGKAASRELPKPPSAPVHLCKCPPPPKMHPGSCPCYEEIEDPPIIIIEPCAKPKHPCPEQRVYYCPTTKVCEKNEKVCNDNKKPTKP